MGNTKLSAALGVLSNNPRDLQALIDAGNAALSIGDLDAASGFFKRADQVSSGDLRAKAGLAGVLARSGDPLAAIAMFNEVEKAGGQASLLAADRGLAYDLVGDNDAAQRLYRLALARTPNAEVTRRLAISQAISGNAQGSEDTLLPLLRDQDKAAWRVRSFSLAIMGQPDEATRTARTILPNDFADSISPYLRYMGQLTRKQQAAAAHLGLFPRSADIGRDSVSIPSVPVSASPSGGSATRDIAAALRAAQAARTPPTAGHDEKFRALFQNWAALEEIN